MPRGARTGRRAVGTIEREVPPPRRGLEAESEFDWERVAVLGVGIAVGALLGAGVSFFTAPMSGPAARRAVRRTARRALWRGQDAWEDLRDELSAATLRRKKDLRRRRRRARETWHEARDRF